MWLGAKVGAAIAPLGGMDPTSHARRLSALKVISPRDWGDELRLALKTAGSIPGAASLLGIGRRTLERWLAETPVLRIGISLVAHGGVRKSLRGKAPSRRT